MFGRHVLAACLHGCIIFLACVLTARRVVGVLHRQGDGCVDQIVVTDGVGLTVEQLLTTIENGLDAAEGAADVGNGVDAFEHR